VPFSPPSGVGPAGLDHDEFSAAVTSVTSAFGDPTRRDIYLLIRDSTVGVTAGEVAEHFELHPTSRATTSRSSPPAATSSSR